MTYTQSCTKTHVFPSYTKKYLVMLHIILHHFSPNTSPLAHLNHVGGTINSESQSIGLITEKELSAKTTKQSQTRNYNSSTTYVINMKSNIYYALYFMKNK